MISSLVLCSGCSRHFRLRDATCPFCGAPSSEARVRPRPAPLRAGASRARRHAAGAALLAGGAMVACASDSTSSSSVGDTDGGGLDGGGSGGDTSTGGRLINGTGGTAAGGAGGAGTGGAAGGSGGIGGGQTCDGAMNPAGVLCRTYQDCTGVGTGGAFMGSTGCYMSIPPAGCGNPFFQPQECTVNADCGDAGVVCQEIACGGHVCAAACDPATCNGENACVDGLCTPKPCDEAGAAPCGAGFVCNPADPTAPAGGCVLAHCTSSGTDCRAGYDCDPNAPGAGCVHRPCTVDSNCECGYCVNGYCEATLGFCYQIVAMPYGCVWPDEELV